MRPRTQNPNQIAEGIAPSLNRNRNQSRRDGGLQLPWVNVPPLNLNLNLNLPLPAVEKAQRLRLRLRLGLRLRTRRRLALAQPVIGVGPDQTDQHGNNFAQCFFSSERHASRAAAFGAQNIQPCGAFQRRPARDVKITAPVRRCKFPVSFSKIENNRRARPIQLVPRRQGLRQGFQNGLEPGDKSQAPLVDFQFFVIEQGGAGISSLLHIRAQNDIIFYLKVKSILAFSPLNPNLNLPLFERKGQEIKIKIKSKITIKIKNRSESRSAHHSKSNP
jgi:hypothetical protein